MRSAGHKPREGFSPFQGVLMGPARPTCQVRGHGWKRESGREAPLRAQLRPSGVRSLPTLSSHTVSRKGRQAARSPERCLLRSRFRGCPAQVCSYAFQPFWSLLSVSAILLSSLSLSKYSGIWRSGRDSHSEHCKPASPRFCNVWTVFGLTCLPSFLSIPDLSRLLYHSK